MPGWTVYPSKYASLDALVQSRVVALDKLAMHAMSQLIPIYGHLTLDMPLKMFSLVFKIFPAIRLFGS